MGGDRARIAFLTNTAADTRRYPSLPAWGERRLRRGGRQAAVRPDPYRAGGARPGHQLGTSGRISGTGVFAVDRSRAVALVWKQMAREAHTVGQRLVFIEYVYRLLGRLPNSWLIAIAGLGHRFMEARHMRGIKRRAEASNRAA